MLTADTLLLPTPAAASRALAIVLVDANGNQITSLSGNAPATATETTVNQSASSVTILVANANRKRFFLYNNAPKTLWLFYGVTAVVNKGFPVPANSPYQGLLGDYTGLITGIWASAGAGTAEVTEVTP